MESKETEMKRPLEPSLPWMRNREEPEDDSLDRTPKRSCTGGGGDGDNYEEFFALLQRIEATHSYCLRTRNRFNRQGPAAKCAQAAKAAWRPSFEWEDFSGRGTGTRDVDPSDGQVLEKEAVPTASNNVKQPSPEASLNPDLEGLDLNNFPAELPLFQ